MVLNFIDSTWNAIFIKSSTNIGEKNRFRHRHIQSRGQSERWTNKAQKQTTSLPKFTQATGRHIIACTKEAFSNFQAHPIRKKVKVDARKADDSNEKSVINKKKNSNKYWNTRRLYNGQSHTCDLTPRLVLWCESQHTVFSGNTTTGLTRNISRN